MTMIVINNAEHMKIRMRRQLCGCNQLQQVQPWIGELCICVPKSSIFSMSCICPQVQQQLQQSNYCGCNLHAHIGQQCQTGCQQSCNTQCNPYMSQMHCENACNDACIQSCNLQQHQNQQSGNLLYWNPNINSLQQSYPYSYQQLSPILEQCFICLISCEQLCNNQQPFLDGNRMQCGCMQQCQPSCSSSNMQSQPFSIIQQQCMPHCQQNCQQFCNQQMISNQQCQPQCKQHCTDICIISSESQFATSMNPFSNPISYSYLFPHLTQSQFCFANCFDSCKQSCGKQQTIQCSNPCTQNCQQFCQYYQQQQQTLPVIQQAKQPYKPQIIRVGLHASMLESTQCIPQCQQTCLQQCSTNLIKAQCQPACQTICQQNCGHRQLPLQTQQQQQQQQLTQCQQTTIMHCYCTNGNIPCNNGSQCCKKH
ncbi:unnamed protein product [Brugia pahangi]|uniref:Uncharacterized protein n=1 Tax=Brugia pahangi TaxID=6280 RepID=A0A0N4TWS6_BRUPA|nr:unnamed protein product [Brugia pahangi]